MSLPRTTEERVMMMRLFSKFQSAHEVQRQWNHYFDTTPPGLTTILAVNRTFDETGSVEDLQRSGRPTTVLTEEKLEDIKEILTTNPNLSIRQDSDKAVMATVHLKPDHPTLIIDLNEDDFDRRSQFCEIWLEKFKNDPHLVDHIFWSDEDRFNRNGAVNRHNCTYWSSENPHIKFKVPKTQEGVIVLCDLTSGGVLNPYFFKETVTGPVYKQMLVDYAWPQLKRKRLCFQHARAGPQYAVMVRNRLDKKFSGRWVDRRGPFDWPAHSPDLVPCDFSL